jgi:Major Facilitator Superfamily
VRVKRYAQLGAAGVAALALADAGVVALALPPILIALHTTVAGVAAVLGVYALVLGLALPVAGHAAVSAPGRVGVIGVLAFALASLGCGLAGSLPLLLVLRAVQAAGGAAVLAAAFALLADGRPDGGSLWRAATLLGTATGPALGGVITQVLGWRAIFLVQAPLVLLALPAFVRAGRPRVEEGGPLPHGATIMRAGVALALVSAALTAVIFLTVLLLVTGWSVEPIAAAVVVSVLPLAAVGGARLRGSPAGLAPARHPGSPDGAPPVSSAGRAAGGSLLVAAGTACLGFVPTDTLWWVVGPEAIAGVGMGLALPALAGELLPERTVRQATALLCTRHLGIAAGLAILAPVMTSSIDGALDTARLHGAALILDARIDPLEKVNIAQQLEGAVNTEQPLRGVRKVFRDNTGDIPSDQLQAWTRLERRGSETLVASVNDAFAPGYAVGAALAALAALAIAPAGRHRRRPIRRAGMASGRQADASRRLALVAAGVAIALLVPAAYALAADRAKPPPVKLGDPCRPRNLPSTGGITGFAQDAILVAIDRAACHAGSSREALVLALTSDSAAKAYKDKYGVDPNSLTSLLGAVLGG